MKKFQAILMVPTEAVTDAENIKEASKRFLALNGSIRPVVPTDKQYDPVAAMLHSIYETGTTDDTNPQPQLPVGSDGNADDPGPAAA